MQERTKPETERIYIPDDWPEVYQGQWVERTIAISDETNRVVHQVLNSPLYRGKDIDTTTSMLSLISATVIIDWNLATEDGPLPAPWNNANAFRELSERDIFLFEWTTSVASELCGYDRKGAENQWRTNAK